MASITGEVGTPPGDRRRGAAARSRWLGYGFILWAAVLGAESGWLTVTLPHRHLTPNWNIAWGGFDVILAVSLVATGIAAWRGSAWFPTCAVATATLLVVDAWFDILTSSPGRELATAIFMALVVELPFAGLCLWIARRRTRTIRLTSSIGDEPGEVESAA